jgi:hypothetical protein
METTRNKGIEIKKVPRFTIASYAIHWSTRSMIVLVHTTIEEMFQNKVSHVELKKDEVIINMVLIVKTSN